MERLRIKLEEKVTISESEWEFIVSRLEVKTYKKKEFLIKSNTIENKIHFILEGVF
ncbi:hypothetical protein [Flavobacterium sp.]|uniref:hypothetical protein n=1 Tax=Flavobacterium sp. TaxID=239 RepID=UPI003F6A3C7D